MNSARGKQAGDRGLKLKLRFTMHERELGLWICCSPQQCLHSKWWFGTQWRRSLSPRLVQRNGRGGRDGEGSEEGAAGLLAEVLRGGGGEGGGARGTGTALNGETARPLATLPPLPSHSRAGASSRGGKALQEGNGRRTDSHPSPPTTPPSRRQARQGSSAHRKPRLPIPK